MKAPLLSLVAAAALCASSVGCGDGEETGATAAADTTAPVSDVGSTAPTATTTATPDSPPPRPLRAPPCPPSDNCERATGEIAFVESLDPDGDGDAHFVLLSTDSITAPGISVVDVRIDLRPHPLPKPGDQLAASGPVYQGSYGQSQIQADAIRFRRTEG